MGMRVSGSSYSAASQGTSSVNNWQQRRQAMSSLTDAMQSGNLSSAKQAYSTLTSGKTPPADSPLAKLGAAIDSGNVSAAQNAFQTLQSARHGHHQYSSSQASTTTSVGTTSTVGNNVNTFA